MAEQDDTLRAAQIAAVRDVMDNGADVAAEMVDAVMALADTNTGRLWVFSLDAKPDVLFADGRHRYWSTHCRHDRHTDCSATSFPIYMSIDGQLDPEPLPVLRRKPAQCKTCAAPCICPCHHERPSAPESGRDRPTHPDLPDEGRTGRGGGQT